MRLAPGHIKPDDVNKWHEEPEPDAITVDGRLTVRFTARRRRQAQVREPDELHSAVQIQPRDGERPDRQHHVGVFEGADELVSTDSGPQPPTAYAVGAAQGKLQVFRESHPDLTGLKRRKRKEPDTMPVG